MATENKSMRILVGIAVAIAQVVMTQVVTFVVSFLVPFGDIEGTGPLPTGILMLIGLTMSAGIFLAGWLALKLRWLAAKPRYLSRLILTLVGAYIPIITGVFTGGLPPGSSAFAVSIVLGLIGFYVPDWVGLK